MAAQKRKADDGHEGQPVEKKRKVTDDIFPSLADLKTLSDARTATDNQEIYLGILKHTAKLLKRAAADSLFRGTFYIASTPPLQIGLLTQMIKDALPNFDVDVARAKEIKRYKNENPCQNPRCETNLHEDVFKRSATLDCFRVWIQPVEEAPEPSIHNKFESTFCSCFCVVDN
jgi:hypothetical protein